jgi:hypothetical protein
VRLHTVGRAVGTPEQGEDVVDLLTVILRLGTRQLQQRLLQLETRRAEQLLDSESRRDEQPVRCPAALGLPRADQGLLAAVAGRPAARAAEAEVKAPGVQGVDQAEFLDRRQRGAVAELDRAGSDPDHRGGAGGQRKDDGW